MPAETPRLQVDHLTVTFGGLTALTDVSFTVGDAEIVALIGPNGAGKTTVFNAICGLVRPSSGKMWLSGRPAPTSPTGLLDHGVARTLQGLGLFTGMTVLENVLLPLTSQPDSAGDPVEAARAMLADLDLIGVADHGVDTLAYPDRKRVALARAMVTGPRLLLLDEPAGGLGADDIAGLADTIRAVVAGGSSVLLVEHHVDFVMDVADRVVVLDFGEVVACGSPDEVRADPAVEAAYLGVVAVR